MPTREAPDTRGPIDFDAAALGAAFTQPAPVRGWSPDAVEVVASTGSTNSDLVDYGRRSAHGPCGPSWPARRLLAALDQSAGRGRHGRAWLSGSGQITFSIGLRLDLAPAALGGFALVCGLAVLAALARSGVDGRLKWPNDLVDAQGAKIGGLLVEIVGSGSAGPVWVVLGIGINRRLGTAAREQLAERIVTDLAAAGAAALDANRFAADVVDELEARLETFVPHGFAPFRQAFDQVHLYHDRKVRLSDGQAGWEGRFAGVGAGGEARLVDPQGREVTQLSGELSLRPAPASTSP